MPDLTVRDRKILALIAQGLTGKEIAHLLGISQAGVNWHVAAAIRKLGASNRVEAVAIAVRRGLLSNHDEVP